jgi:methionyl-tRNA formyltransferase
MSLRIAFFGQAAFGRDVLVRLLEAGHDVVAVYAPPEGRRPDPLAQEASERGLRLIRHAAMRRKGGAPIPSRVAEHAALGADLNVLAFVTMILPAEIVDAPAHGSICFHPSILPRFRGGSALAWQIIEGEKESGVTVFRPDAGVDTGPIVVQKRGVTISPTHTAASLYFDALYALGVDAMVEAVEKIDAGSARYQPQDEAQATFQGLVDDAVAAIDWTRPSIEIDRRVRGCDPQPGAHTRWGGREIRLFDAQHLAEAPGGEPPGTVVGLRDGAAVIAAPGGRLLVGRVRVDGGAKQSAADAGLTAGERLG